MSITDQEFETITKYIHKVIGIDIGTSKRYLIKQRLEPLIRDMQLGSFQGLIKKLIHESDLNLRNHLIEAITTNETFFFRDVHPFETFYNTILPELGELVLKRKSAKGGRRGAKVGIWCAASSTGQEPYTLAMLVAEYAAANRHRGVSATDFSILATDISSAVLSRAIGASYTDLEIGRGLSPARKEKYFRKEGDKWELAQEIQQLVDFRKVNLSDPFLMLGSFDMIFCRNVLIYFNDETKRKIIEQFLTMLSMDGLLMLGACENMTMLTDRFESVRKNETIYYRTVNRKGATV